MTKERTFSYESGGYLWGRVEVNGDFSLTQKGFSAKRDIFKELLIN